MLWIKKIEFNLAGKYGKFGETGWLAGREEQYR